MRVLFPKGPQSWDTPLAAPSRRDGQRNPAGCEVPWRWLEQAPTVPGAPLLSGAL